MRGRWPRAPLRLTELALALAVTLLLAGCPYSTDEPLSDPASSSPDPGLVGTWQSRNGDEEEANRITFLPFDEHEMVAFFPGNAEEKPELYRVFVTEIGGERFLNLRQLGEDGGGWLFARCRIDGERLVLRILDDALFGDSAFPSPQARLDFIRAHLDDPLLYAGEGNAPLDMLFDRVPAEE